MTGAFLSAIPVCCCPGNAPGNASGNVSGCYGCILPRGAPCGNINLFRLHVCFFKNLYILYKLHIFSSKCLCDSLHRRQILHWRHSHFFFKLSGKILYRSIGQTCSNFCDVAIFFPHHFPCTPDLHSAEIFHWSASELFMEKMLQRRPAHIKNITECIHIDLLLNMLLHIADDLNQSGTFQMCCLFRQLKPFGIVRLFFPLPTQRQQKQLQIQQNHLLRVQEYFLYLHIKIPRNPSFPLSLLQLCRSCSVPWQDMPLRELSSRSKTLFSYCCYPS